MTTTDSAAAPAAAGGLTPKRARYTRKWTPRIVAFGEFIDGYDLLVVGAAMIFLKPAFGLSSFEVGWLTAVAFIGAAVGLVVFGDLSDRFGRKVIFVINLVFFVAASIAAAFVTEVWQLMIARFLIGVAVGMDIPTSHAFLAEISPKARRGRIAGSLPNVMWLLGAVTSVLVALALRDVAGENTWRWMFGFAAVPAFAVLIARQFLPESPRWLRAQGRHEEARQVFELLGVEEPKAAPAPPKRDLRELLRDGAGRRLAVVAGFFAFNAFGGAVATVAGPLVMTAAGIDVEHALYFSLGGYLIGLTGVLLGALVIDRVNRRTLGISACLGVFVAGMGIAFLGPESDAALLAFWLAYSLLTWFGPGVLAWVWSSEAFPTQLRGVGSGIAQSAARLMAALNVALIPTMLDSFGLKTVAIAACAYVVCAGLVFSAPFLATTGRELEETNAQQA
ncbi:MFS transporter [Streptomyces indicus]|uniref:MFS transporter, putative metabolite transport protein n=1 Tax=Streptomyces indicus TaxID=417292 RepID=A0A1G9IJS1_9ACTN|nr:MFS transporter [Streptomyces indicus]SDL25336.1 MFS transporter, putative metabolite transport protein [Streptomyces indicus]